MHLSWLPRIPLYRAAMLPSLAGVLFAVSGCSQFGAAGPGSRAVNHAAGKPVGAAAVRIVDVDDEVARHLLAANHASLFSEVFGEVPPVGGMIGRGDVLDISIWEAPPAALFGTSAAGSLSGTALASGMARSSELPEQMVDGSGQISVPFVGGVVAAGRSTTQIAQEISNRLSGIAHKPQVIVRRIRNATAEVTVVGDVNSSTRLPLTPKGERLLDALASAGGSRQPVGKSIVRVSRGGEVASLPLERVITDPAQNIRLKANDVVTVLFQPYSFTALGATSANAEVPFEGTGLTLAQALGRIGGLRDDRANPRSVFIFRFEDATMLPAVVGQRTTPDGRIPTIYRIDLTNPSSLFVAQEFAIRNRDVLYVSNAPVVDFQKFVGLVSSLAVTGLSIGSTVP
ncbi:MAG: polysaccharide export protein [Sphingomonadales bacterium]|nr:polysaccharide export protein [Sphingomonadales bacterium]